MMRASSTVLALALLLAASCVRLAAADTCYFCRCHDAGLSPSAIAAIPGTLVTSDSAPHCNLPQVGHCYRVPCNSVNGDPIVSGFDDSLFMYIGEPGKTYNFLSTQTSQLNALFIDGELDSDSSLLNAFGLGKSEAAPTGTFIGSLGFQYGSQSIMASVDKAGALSALRVNGKEMLAGEDSFSVQLVKGLTVDYQRFRPWFGQSVSIMSPDFDMVWYPTLEHDDEEEGHVRGHLNLRVMTIHVTEDEVEGVHGVLGQTLRKAVPELLGGGHLSAETMDKQPVNRTVTAFAGEGKESDYEVSGLFSRDFAFNQLAAHEPTLTVFKRRLMRLRKAL